MYSFHLFAGEVTRLMDKSPEVMAALQAKLDVANERITQLTDEAWSFHIFTTKVNWRFFSTSLSANQHSKMLLQSLIFLWIFPWGSSDIWIHGMGEIRDSHRQVQPVLGSTIGKTET